jgi:hypothetical protein
MGEVRSKSARFERALIPHNAECRICSHDLQSIKLTQGCCEVLLLISHLFGKSTYVGIEILSRGL